MQSDRPDRSSYSQPDEECRLVPGPCIDVSAHNTRSALTLLEVLIGVCGQVPS